MAAAQGLAQGFARFSMVGHVLVTELQLGLALLSEEMA